MDLTHPDRLPIIPETILREHDVYQPMDTRFRAAARLLQSIWRARRGLAAGSYLRQDDQVTTLGSRLTDQDAAAGANFMDASIAKLVRREVAYREPGAMVDEQRLWTNLLSSMPLVFNVFAPLKQDLRFAGAVCRELWPDLIEEVSQIQFEHSPARGDLAFTGDGTAFDVFISGRSPSGAKTFVAIEVKYSEAMTEGSARPRPRYDELAQTCGLYKEPGAPELRAGQLQQLFREHMLATTLVSSRLYDKGIFVCVAPRLNWQVQRACSVYADHLSEADFTCPFQVVALENLIEALSGKGKQRLVANLSERYTDFTPVHALF